MEIANKRRVLGSYCMKTAEMCFSKTSVHFGRCYGNKEWAKTVKKYVFVSKISSCKLSKRFRSVAHGVLEILEEVYWWGRAQWGHKIGLRDYCSLGRRPRGSTGD